MPQQTIKPPRRVLPVLVLAQLLGTSPWFAVNAVMPDLQAAGGWNAAAVGTLTAALQGGFIAGTLVFALLAVADRWPARRVFVVCATAAALCTLAAAGSVTNSVTNSVANSVTNSVTNSVANSAAGFGPLLAWRALTGFFLAGVYPVGMKLAAQWFPQGLGGALGWLIGALVLGSASPHALRAWGASWAWQWVFVGVAGAALAAALLVWWALPEPAVAPRAAGTATPPPALQLGALTSLWRSAQLRPSVLGYFGHMWELYSVWVLMPLVLATRLANPTTVSTAAFFVLGAGAVGCVLGGVVARRWGSARVAAAQLGTSGLCCLLAPLMLTAPLPLFLAWLLLWGVTVAGDSPQLSALTAANAPRQAVGSVLTLTNSIGFAVSAVSIELFVRLAQTVPLAQLLPWLAVGPALGLWGLWALVRRKPH